MQKMSFPRASSGDLLFNEKEKKPFVLPLIVQIDASFITYCLSTSYKMKNQNIRSIAVEAARRNHLRLRCVEFHLGRFCS